MVCLKLELFGMTIVLASVMSWKQKQSTGAR